jgi:DNA-binding LacI/PurR family transcriptional regulator
MTTILKRGVSVAAAAIIAAIAVAGAAKAEDKKFTVAIVMPSLDISYWQWVAYGAKTKAQELGMNSIELDSHDSPTEQMSNIRTAITKGANAIVIGAKLHLGDHTQHGQDHATHRPTGIDGGLQHSEACSLLLQFVDEVENVARVPA